MCLFYQIVQFSSLFCLLIILPRCYTFLHTVEFKICVKIHVFCKINDSFMFCLSLFHPHSKILSYKIPRKKPDPKSVQHCSEWSPEWRQCSLSKNKRGNWMVWWVWNDVNDVLCFSQSPDLNPVEGDFGPICHLSAQPDYYRIYKSFIYCFQKF